jgi:hypothetical protein
MLRLLEGPAAVDPFECGLWRTQLAQLPVFHPQLHLPADHEQVRTRRILWPAHRGRSKQAALNGGSAHFMHHHLQVPYQSLVAEGTSSKKQESLERQEAKTLPFFGS